MSIEILRERSIESAMSEFSITRELAERREQFCLAAEEAEHDIIHLEAALKKARSKAMYARLNAHCIEQGGKA